MDVAGGSLDGDDLLSWPPRSSTAWTKWACRLLVHLMRGALMLRSLVLAMAQELPPDDDDEEEEIWL